MVTIDAVAKSRYHAVELDHPEDEDRKMRELPIWPWKTQLFLLWP
jgi:hypothetical protein